MINRLHAVIDVLWLRIQVAVRMNRAVMVLSVLIGWIPSMWEFALFTFYRNYKVGFGPSLVFDC